jgi:hypothetical protein
MTRSEIIARAEQHVRLGQRQIFDQHELILAKALSGKSAGIEVDLLKFFQSLQAIRVGQVERLSRRLQTKSPPRT